MNKSRRIALYQSHAAETAEEIIGVLTAISVVSKRMAKKLTLLEQMQSSAQKGGGKPNDRSKRVSRHSN